MDTQSDFMTASNSPTSNHPTPQSGTHPLTFAECLDLHSIQHFEELCPVVIHCFASKASLMCHLNGVNGFNGVNQCCGFLIQLKVALVIFSFPEEKTAHNPLQPAYQRQLDFSSVCLFLCLFRHSNSPTTAEASLTFAEVLK